MNKTENDILLCAVNNPKKTQRDIAKCCNCSVGCVNKSLKILKENDYLMEDNTLTEKAKNKLVYFKPQKAFILADGYGINVVSTNKEVPHSLIKVHDEVLIERIIKQLNEKNIHDITIIIGYMKESFEYLIDKYQVKLVVNNKYKDKNSLYTLSLVAENLSNSYIIPSNIWCKINPFNDYELYSWYMVTDKDDKNSNIRVNRSFELIKSSNTGNKTMGMAYIGPDYHEQIESNIKKLVQDSKNNNAVWERALYSSKDKMMIKGKIVSNQQFFEIKTYEDLQELDEKSIDLYAKAIEIIETVFQVQKDKIKNIEVLKKGMTNRSFSFMIDNIKYIMRIPGEGTDQLINREEEYEVCNALKNINISDEVIYMNPANGYKITKYIENARNCDPNNIEDLKKCMNTLREFHRLNLKVNHKFDVFKQINFYESLWNNKKSIYQDYENTKKNVFSLQKYIDENIDNYTLTHIDAVPDNFLIYEQNNQTNIRLIDWEYAGMQDPHIDIAMFAIYSFYDKTQIDELIDIYFENKCALNIRIKIYCYVAACGLLWSNWCEYKRDLGIEFGEYSLRQYRYAKDFYNIAISLIDEVNKNA